MSTGSAVSAPTPQALHGGGLGGEVENDACDDVCVGQVVFWEHVLVGIHDRVWATPVIVLVVDPGREEHRHAVGEGKATVSRFQDPCQGAWQTDCNLISLRGVLAHIQFSPMRNEGNHFATIHEGSQETENRARETVSQISDVGWKSFFYAVRRLRVLI